MSSLHFFLMHYFGNCLGGGHVITPTKHDKPSIVKHMISIDWKLWKPYMKKGATVSMTIRFLKRIAGIFQCTKKEMDHFIVHVSLIYLVFSSFMLQH